MDLFEVFNVPYQELDALVKGVDYTPYCTETDEERKERYKENRIRRNEYKKQWYDDNKEKILEERREYYKKDLDREKYRKKNKNQYYKDLEKSREYSRNRMREKRKKQLCPK